jgi:hypothetical protein
MVNENFQDESWLDLYRSALVELENAKMTGRIQAARTEIVARLEKLETMPRLHAEERMAISDALSGLRVLEHEQARHDAEERQRILDRSLRSLRSVAPAILKMEQDQSS